MKIVDLKIGTRLGASFGLIVLLLIALAAVSLQRMSVVQDRVRDITEGNNVQSALANEMLHSLDRRTVAVRELFLFDDQARLKANGERIAAEEKHYTEVRDQLAALFTADPNTAPEEKELMQKAADIEKATSPLVQRAMMLYVSGREDSSPRTMVQQTGPQQELWQSTLAQLVKFEDTSNREAASNAAAVYRSAQITIASLAALAVALAIGFGLFATLSITRPIGLAVEVAERVAQGDLTTRITVGSQDETGRLLNALQRMQTSLTNMVNAVRQNADSVSTASTQIAQGNSDLSARTEEQASALEQTSSSMEQLGATVQQNADHARQASELAKAASAVVTQGGDAVGQVVATMKQINDSSKQIAEIIGVIDGIAFQTNILALNAAVEAARAGDQGRGFAVVASEVRGLARRSADAAKDIKTLIGSSVERVAAGASQADRAGVTMQEVVTSIRRVTDIAREISDASAEQSAGVAQIGEAVTQMDRVTQQNAALVEESAAAAESLNAQARQLVDAISAFKTSSREHALA